MNSVQIHSLNSVHYGLFDHYYSPMLLVPLKESPITPDVAPTETLRTPELTELQKLVEPKIVQNGNCLLRDGNRHNQDHVSRLSLADERSSAVANGNATLSVDYSDDQCSSPGTVDDEDEDDDDFSQNYGPNQATATNIDANKTISELFVDCEGRKIYATKGNYVQCVICDAKIKVSSNIHAGSECSQIKHHAIAHLPSYWSCNLCGKMSNRKNDGVRHIKQRHGEKMEVGKVTLTIPAERWKNMVRNRSYECFPFLKP